MQKAFLKAFLGFTLIFSPFEILAKSDLPLALAEIQNSIEKEFKVKFPEQHPLPPEELPDLDKKPVQEAPKKKEKEAPKKETTREGLSQKLEDKLAKNRDILRKRRGEFRKKRLAVKEGRQKEKKNSPFDKGRVSGDGLQDKKAAYEDWIKSKKDSINRWQADRLATLKKWAEERQQLKKDLPALKKDLTDIPFSSAPVKVSSKKPKKPYQPDPKVKKVTKVAQTIGAPLELSFIEENFRLPIRQQGKRPTCAAFAAVRALEILAMGKGEKINLSEQYFYYASKPKCQRSPCNRPGSWPRQAFENSKRSAKADIPTEAACPYKDTAKSGNETQIPLRSTCFQGQAKVTKYSQVVNRFDIQNRIRAGQPVIAGFKLSEDFFLNTGYVFKEPGQKVGKDLHSQGHALLLVGVMELPKGLHDSQGEFCTIVANSWGEGWGRGGHACISDAWFDEYRYDMPFLAVEDIAIN